MGKPTAQQRRAADVLLKALDEGIAMMRPGADAGEIDKVLREPVLDAGLRESYHHRVGYTLGLTYPPTSGEYIRQFMAGSSWRLEAGQVFHMLLIAAGIGFSETVLVTDDGPELLTHFERRLSER